MSYVLDLDDESSIFNFLLSENIYDIEEKYIDSLNTLDTIITTHLDNKFIPDLCEQNNIFNIDSIWINNKYRELIQNQMNIDLITSHIINFIGKKSK
tara:strand:- start:347 stop:637 length:291 start_codon:yes stop_codon:yes gene_type:complete